MGQIPLFLPSNLTFSSTTGPEGRPSSFATPQRRDGTSRPLLVCRVLRSGASSGAFAPRASFRSSSPIGSAPRLGKFGINQSSGTRPRSVDWVAGAAFLLRREALNDVGVFDEAFFIYFEEVDLCLRLRQAGWEVRYFPGVTVVHHESQFSVDIPERRINEMWRGRRRYWEKHHSPAGARLAALATGGQYLGAAAVGVIRRDAAYRASMRLHARTACRGDGPGLRELAEEWNRRVGGISSLLFSRTVAGFGRPQLKLRGVYVRIEKWRSHDVASELSPPTPG